MTCKLVKLPCATAILKRDSASGCWGENCWISLVSYPATATLYMK